jgi:NADH:ubiquinone oxidoreductase subunit 3 (subunit A)
MSSTCFKHPSVHPQEDLNMQFYGISFMHPYKQPDRWQDVLDTQYQAHPAMQVTFDIQILQMFAWKCNSHFSFVLWNIMLLSAM